MYAKLEVAKVMRGYRLPLVVELWRIATEPSKQRQETGHTVLYSMFCTIVGRTHSSSKIVCTS